MPRLSPSILAVAIVALALPMLPGAAAEVDVALAGDWKVRVADTAAGVSTPKSVNSREMRDGGV